MTDSRIAFPSSSSSSKLLRSSQGRKSKLQPDLQEIHEATKDGQVQRPRHSGWKSWLSDVTPPEWALLGVSTVIKVLLFPSYRSTDFEVHRNWLAITHSLPISQWYFDTTSEWTLDYPPFFAYFEWVLSIPASIIDNRIVDVQNINFDAWSVIIFQRLTVIITELVLAAALQRFVRGSVDQSTQRIISVSLFLHPGFLIVDHIHFQYNGFMFGILLWSLLMARNGDLLGCGFLFAVLLNFKHIYMYQAPAYFVYLLRAYCMSPSGGVHFTNLLSLANIVIAVFVISFGPFILMGQIPQLISRLFPFKRGLNHAYWAPNGWALVTAADRVLLQVVKRIGANVILNVEGISSTSRGLVGDTVFAVLPNVKPMHTFGITIALQSIFMVKLWRNPSYKSFLCALALCGYVSYMFGWHVHEKAILLVLVPLSLLASENHAMFRTFVIASVAGIYSLFPLLFTPAETPIKVVYSVLWMYFVFQPLVRRLYEFPRSFTMVVIDYLEKLYLIGFLFLHIFVSTFPLLMTGGSENRSVSLPENTNATECIPGRGITCSESNVRRNHAMSTGALEFLPLMATSVYCAFGITWAFLRLSFIYLKSSSRP